MHITAITIPILPIKNITVFVNCITGTGTDSVFKVILQSSHALLYMYM